MNKTLPGPSGNSKRRAPRKTNPSFKTGDLGIGGRTSNAFSYREVPRHVIDTLYGRLTDDLMSVKAETCLCSTREGNSSGTNASPTGPRIAMDYEGMHYNLLCKVVYMMYHNNNPKNAYDTASHLCGNQYCMNHCVWEPLYMNTWRELCFSGVLNDCPHTPKCMKQVNMEAVKKLVNEQKELRATKKEEQKKKK